MLSWKIKEWKIEDSENYLTILEHNKEIILIFKDYTVNEIIDFDWNMVKRLFTKLNYMNNEAHQMIKEYFPNENIYKLESYSIIFNKNSDDSFFISYLDNKDKEDEKYFQLQFNLNFQAFEVY